MDYRALWRRSADPNTVESARGLPNEDEVRRNLAGTVSRAENTLSSTLRGYQLLLGAEYALSERPRAGAAGPLGETGDPRRRRQLPRAAQPRLQSAPRRQRAGGLSRQHGRRRVCERGLATGISALAWSQLTTTLEDGLVACFFALWFVFSRHVAKKRGHCTKLDRWQMSFALAVAATAGAAVIHPGTRAIPLIAGAVVGAVSACVSIRAARPFGIPRRGPGTNPS